MTNIRVYRYGLLPPTEAADVLQQMRLAHRYRNTLVEIERGRRAAIHAILAARPEISAPTADFERADIALQTALQGAAAAKSDARASTAPEHLRDAVVQARAARRAAVNALYEARRVALALPEVQAEIDLIAGRAGALRRGARALCGVFWGTYLLIEDADAASRKMPLYDDGQPNASRFVRWEGEGRVGVQIQKTKPLMAPLLGTDTRVRLTPGKLPPHADPKSRRSALRQRCTLALRISSNEDRSPQWAHWPMIMHRPLPDGAHIKYVTVQLRMVGPRQEWSALFTVDLGDARPLSVPSTLGKPGPAGRVAIDIGWRVTEDGLRVAAWRDDAGNTGTLLLSADRTAQHEPAADISKHAQRSSTRRAAGVLGRFRKADDLQAIRKKNFNVARRNLLIHHLTALGPAMPAWLREATQYLALWKSQGKLAALAQRWRSNRFDGDAEAYDALEAWRYQDHHLWEWETSQRLKALRYRREIYRCWAAEMATRYASVVLEDFDLRRVARTPRVESVGPENETARSHRVIAATSALRADVLHAFRSRGGDTLFVNPAFTTKTCAACGSVEQWNQAEELRHQCSSCNAEWDQDDNASANLLAWCEQSGGAPTPKTARKKSKPSDPAHIGESRWTRAKRMAAEKRTRQDTARKRVA